MENHQSLYWCKDVRFPLFPRHAVVKTRWFVNPTQTLYHINEREGGPSQTLFRRKIRRKAVYIFFFCSNACCLAQWYCDCYRQGWRETFLHRGNNSTLHSCPILLFFSVMHYGFYSTYTYIHTLHIRAMAELHQFCT